jgi:hypothetical protein
MGVEDDTGDLDGYPSAAPTREDARASGDTGPYIPRGAPAIGDFLARLEREVPALEAAVLGDEMMVTVDTKAADRLLEWAREYGQPATDAYVPRLLAVQFHLHLGDALRPVVSAASADEPPLETLLQLLDTLRTPMADTSVRQWLPMLIGRLEAAVARLESSEAFTPEEDRDRERITDLALAMRSLPVAETLLIRLQELEMRAHMHRVETLLGTAVISAEALPQP